MTTPRNLQFDRVPLSGLSEQVTLALEEAILVGKLKPGERIVEADVAARLGVSNGPVREALHELENLGLVACIPRRGNFVTQFTAQVAREVFSLRALLEVAALRLVLAKRSEIDLGRLEKSMAMMDSSLREPGQSARHPTDLDMQFHDILFELSGHHLLQQAWQRLRSQARVLLVVTGALRDSASIPSPRHGLGLRAVHEPIFEAIQVGNVDEAERAMIYHLAEGERRIVSRLATPGEETQSLAVRVIMNAKSSESD